MFQWESGDFGHLSSGLDLPDHGVAGHGVDGGHDQHLSGADHDGRRDDDLHGADLHHDVRWRGLA